MPLARSSSSPLTGHAPHVPQPLQRVAGHRVRNPALASLGCDGLCLAYAVGRAALAVSAAMVDPDGDVPRAAASLLADSQFQRQTRVYVLEDPTEERISFIHVHPTRDLLCVGTEQHGVYVTSATLPSFTNQSRLPTASTGESIHTACFLMPGDGGEGGGGGGDVLVISSTFTSRKNGSPHRLALWHLQDRALLWRGAMDPLDSMCAFPQTMGFAACTHTAVSLFTVQPTTTAKASSGPNSPLVSGPNNTNNNGSGGRGRSVLVLSRLCSTVEELTSAEYVACAAWPSATDGTFVAITTQGTLVAFDKTTGAVVRWMECRVSPATAVCFSASHVVLTGALTRFFSAASWDFCGKVKTDAPVKHVGSSYLSNLLSSLHTAVVVSSTHVALFSGNGELTVYAWSASTASVMSNATSQYGGGGGGSAPAGGKLSFQRLWQYSPVLAAEEDLRWFVPATGPTWCLWSPLALRVMTGGMQLHRLLPLDSTCAAFHSQSGTVLVYHATSAEVVVYAAGGGGGDGGGEDGAGWRDCLRRDQSEMLTDVCCAAEGDAVAGLGPENTVFFFALRGKPSPSTAGGNASQSDPALELVLTSSRSFRSFPQLHRLYYAGSGGGLYGTTDRSVVHLHSGHEYRCMDDIVAACPAGEDLVLLHRDCCVRYATESKVAQPIVVPLTDLRTLSYDPMCDLLAVANTTSVVVLRLSDGSILCTIDHDPHAAAILSPAVSTTRSSSAGGAKPTAEAAIRSIALLSHTSQVRLRVCDALGLLSEYSVEDSTRSRLSSQGPPPRTPRPGRSGMLPTADALAGADGTNDAAARRLRRSQSVGAPSTVDLQSRFSELSGFYQQQKRVNLTNSPRTGRRASHEAPRTTDLSRTTGDIPTRAASSSFAAMPASAGTGNARFGATVGAPGAATAAGDNAMPAGGRVGRPVAARTATAPNIANVNARGGGGQAAGTGSPAQQLQQQRGNAAGTRPGGATAAAGPANRRPVGSQAPQPWSPQTRRPWEKSAPGQLSQPRTAPANVSGKGPAAAGGKDVGEERGGTPSARASPDASMSNADPAAAGQPTRSQRSPLRRGDAQSAAPGATGGAAAGSGTLFRDGGMGETEGYPDGTLSAGLVAQARQLRPPLVQLQELLEQSAQPGLDPQRAGPPVDLSALSAALTAAAVAVQGYEARRIALTSSPLGSAQQSPKGPPAPGAFAGDAASSGAGSADALHTVFAELQRIQLQNARLEAQNRTILSHLGTKEQ